jgi:hypothetical protein
MTCRAAAGEGLTSDHDPKSFAGCIPWSRTSTTGW